MDDPAAGGGDAPIVPSGPDGAEPGPTWLFTAFVALGATLIVVVLARRGELRRERLLARSSEWTSGEALLWAGLGGVVWFSIQIGAQIATAVAPGAAGLRATAVASLGGYAAAAVAVLALALAMRPALVRHGVRARPADALIGVGVLLLALPVVFAVNMMAFRLAAWWASLGGAPPPEALAHDTLLLLTGPDAWGPWWWATVGAVVVLAPAAEELVYRGFVQAGLVRLAGGPWRGIVATGALFALAHSPIVPPFALPGLFTLAVCLGWATERFGRIGPAVVAHAGFNAANLALAMSGAA